MYAVVQTGGKQYRVSKGDIINVEKLNVEAGSRVVLDEVIALGGEKTVVGKPFVEGASIDCQVIENGKAKKVIIYKYKAKKDYRKKQGHRQPYTQLEVLDILTDGAKPSAQLKAAEEKPAEKKTPSLKSMKKAELIEFAKENNIEIDEKATNAEMIAAIEAGLK